MRKGLRTWIADTIADLGSKGSKEMNGWHISVFRAKGGGEEPPDADGESGEPLAVWQASATGLDWMDQLVRQGKAIAYETGGYPNLYRARAGAILPFILNGPPAANLIWISGPDDIIGTGWLGKTTIYEESIARCEQNEWLLIEAWAES